jgi:dipeptidyl aminopeptidase/acylaminoacyl peptidase
MFGGDISWLILGCGYMQVKVPTLFLLGAQDRRVPVSNGFQYVQALRASGLEVKVILFPEDVHAIDRYAFQRTRCFLEQDGNITN